MPNKSAIALKFILGNFLPFLNLLGLVWICTSGDFFSARTGLAVLAWIYLMPPLFVRILFLVGGKPNGTYHPENPKFWIWYCGAQLQIFFLRFEFLEELLRCIPMLYSTWLRLWGAKIGKHVYWAPQIMVIDRTHLEIGDGVIVGYGAGFTGHYISLKEKEHELIVAAPRIGARSVVGGMTVIGPGAVVGDDETLPATMSLAPFYVWQRGRRSSKLTDAVEKP